jgi:hypothetical protein
MLFKRTIAIHSENNWNDGSRNQILEATKKKTFWKIYLWKQNEN